MGILANTVSICHFRVQGELAGGSDFFTAAPELLARLAFVSIDDSIEELSLGWVHLDDPKAHDFPAAACWRDHYLMFSLRRDMRKVPVALLKEHIDLACTAFLDENPGFTRVPKQRKEEIKDAVRAKLLAKTLPDPKVYDAVWDTRTGILTFAALSPKIIEIFEDQFKKTFEGLRLSAVHPYERAMSLLHGHDQRLLAAANKAGGESYLELIRENRWLGFDFLNWLIYQTMSSDSEYVVNQSGPAARGELFVGFVNDRVVLIGEGEGGTQMITVNGPQGRFSEIKNALQGRKQIAEATIHLDTGDGRWALTLKGEMFHFASFSSPAVKLEKDDTTDPELEREAVFFERMALLEKGLQLFDSLFATFLQARLSDTWYLAEQGIVEWLEAA